MNYSPLVLSLLSKEALTPELLKEEQRAFAKEKKLSTLPSKSQILQSYFQLVAEGKVKKNADLERLLRKRAIRSLS